MPSFISVFGSYLVDGVILGAVAIILSCVLHRGVRTRADAWWTSEIAIGCAFAPLITTLTAISIALLVFAVRHWSVQPPSAAEMATAAGAAVVAGMVFAMLRRGGDARGGQGANRPPAAGPGVGQAA